MSASTDDDYVETGPVVRRPQPNAPKAKSKLRVSFNPGEGDDSGTGASTPAENSIPRSTKPPSRLGLSSAAQDILSRRDQEEREEGRSRYNKAYLDELRNSTPSTPRDLSSSRDSPSLDLVQPSTNLELDLESKFGKSALASSSSSSRIPSAAEIKEKKDRRARRAKEQAANAYQDASSTSGVGAGADFISLEDYDSDGEFRPQRMQVGSYLAPAREKDTRLIHEDEDIAEGFDEYVEDAGRVTLSRKGMKEQSRQDREAIRSMINAAERGGGGVGSGSDTDKDADDNSAASASDSDYERRRAYDLAQTHHGMDGLRSHSSTTRHLTRPRQPRETSTVPKLSVGLTRLRDMVSALELERAKILKRQADLHRERVDIKASQEHIQKSLEEAGQELERVRREHEEKTLMANASENGPTGTGVGATNGHSAAADETRGLGSTAPSTARGLESFGGDS